MTCPTILLQPVIRVTEVEPYGDVITHWDETVTAFRIVMLGGHDVRIIDHDEDGGIVDERIDLRVRLAATIAAHGELSDGLLDTLTDAAIHPQGGRRMVPLDDALAIHCAVTRWAAEEYTAWAQAMVIAA